MKRTHVPAASLLSILLLISVVGIIILAATRALTESTRASSNQSALDEARVAAFTGLQEGLQYLKAGTQLTEGEFGDMSELTAANYSLKPRVGGFKLDSAGNCTVQTLDTTGVNAMDFSHCPSYEMAIRTKVAYGLTGGAALSRSLSLSSADFPQATEVYIPFALSGGFIQLVASELLAPGTTVKIRACSTNDGNDYACGQQTILNPGSSYLLTGTYASDKYLGITVTYPVALTKAVEVLKGGESAGEVTLGKGYTTIDVTGYSIGGKSGGGVVVKYVYAVRNGVPYRTETTGAFNSKGVFNQ